MQKTLGKAKTPVPEQLLRGGKKRAPVSALSYPSRKQRPILTAVILSFRSDCLVRDAVNTFLIVSIVRGCNSNKYSRYITPSSPVFNPNTALWLIPHCYQGFCLSLCTVKLNIDLCDYGFCVSQYNVDHVVRIIRTH